MDTDSIYAAVSKPTLYQAIKPNLREQFHRMVSGSCGDTRPEACYIPRDCCEYHNWLDSRTPNIFKLEWKGDKLIALNSKTYAGTDASGQVKLSCKGVNSRIVKEKNPMQMYSDVLTTRVSASGVNRGFRVDNLGVKSYTQVEKHSAIYI